MDRIRVFVKWLESIDAVVGELHTMVRSPVLRDGQNVRDVMLDSDRAEEILDPSRRGCGANGLRYQ
ncbi:hypothetical protein J2744_000973 [Halorubrum trapanicum]|uniref:Uncharacterized protein n=1 Tax=Halorubrum trapanicum TaxID=29284 RepID=A0A8J7RCA0_9EURY|nr:hypothetical protein [Halorubrum trapanicum]MBP1901303.1 hypothetical protein [Halorubrum trapanicum]